MANKLGAALALATRGFKVFPIAANAKFPPLLNDWPNKATDDLDQIGVLWSKWPDANIGIHCDGFAVIDVDAHKGGDRSLDLLALQEGLPRTLTALTPRGGRHLFYRLPEGHPGVSNSVEKLGKGLDIRSAGGYVVAAGSEIDGKAYRFADGYKIEDAPEWLVQKLGVFIKREQPEKVNVPDTVPENLARAATWLDTQAFAVQGNGGDACTFAVVCGLRDYGASQEQALILLREWNDGCSPPWSLDELAVKVSNCYSYATGEPGSKAALADDFPTIPESGSSVPILGTSAVRLSAFANSEQFGYGYLVKGLLQQRSYAEIFGAPGAGKTFVALDIAYAVASGEPWMKRRTHGGVVLYLAYEGTGGLVKRAKALRQHYGDKDVPLYLDMASYNLREKPGREALGAVIAGLPAKPVLIIIDTFARALMGGDENSAQDVGNFNDAVVALITNTGACVLIVHHSGKNKSAGARGSSAILGAIDTEIEIDNYAIISTKQRDVELSEPLGFKLVPLVVGMDVDGDELTSCVVQSAVITASASGAPLKGNIDCGFNVLIMLSPNNVPVHVDTWRAACVKEFLTAPTTASKYFFKIKKGLLDYGLIEITDDFVTRKLH